MKAGRFSHRTLETIEQHPLGERISLDSDLFAHDFCRFALPLFLFLSLSVNASRSVMPSSTSLSFASCFRSCAELVLTNPRVEARDHVEACRWRKPVRAEAVDPASNPNASEMLRLAAKVPAEESALVCTRWCEDAIACGPQAIGRGLDASRGTREATRWSPSQHARVAEVEKDRCIMVALLSRRAAAKVGCCDGGSGAEVLWERWDDESVCPRDDGCPVGQSQVG